MSYYFKSLQLNAVEYLDLEDNLLNDDGSKLVRLFYNEALMPKGFFVDVLDVFEVDDGHLRNQLRKKKDWYKS